MTGGSVKRYVLAGMAVLTLSSTAGCVAQALCGIPCALEDAATLAARSVQMDENKYVVHATAYSQKAAVPAREPPVQAVTHVAVAEGAGKISPQTGKTPQLLGGKMDSAVTACAGIPPM